MLFPFYTLYIISFLSTLFLFIIHCLLDIMYGPQKFDEQIIISNKIGLFHWTESRDMH